MHVLAAMLGQSHTLVDYNVHRITLCHGVFGVGQICDGSVPDNSSKVRWV